MIILKSQAEQISGEVVLTVISTKLNLDTDGRPMACVPIKIELRSQEIPGLIIGLARLIPGVDC